MADTIKLSVEFPESLVADLWIDEATAFAKMKEAVVRYFSPKAHFDSQRCRTIGSLLPRVSGSPQVPITD